MIKVLVSYEKHHSGNYVLRYEGQEFIVLRGAFLKISGVSQQAEIGSFEVDRDVLREFGI